MNYKGKLQEYCQNKGLDFPKYNTNKLPSPAHDPKFRSIVIIQNKNYISVPSLREVKIPSTSPLQFNDIPLLYEILVKRPDALDCLWSPRIAIEELEDYIKRKIKKI